MLARILGAFLLVFGLLPIANWIPGGYGAPWYSDTLTLWLSGLTLVLGLTGLLLILLRRKPSLWMDGAWSRVAGRWEAGGWKCDAFVAAGALALYALIALLVFDRRPTVVDEFVGLFQARIFASGRLFLPVSDFPALTSALFVVEQEGKIFGQFPAGGPAVLAIGARLGLEWLVDPICGALSVLLLSRILRVTRVAAGVALATVALFVVSPFVASMAGSYMSHVPTLTFILLASAGLAYATRDEYPHAGAAFVCGLGLGIAATIRPLDGLAFALPSAAWLVARLRLGRSHVGALLASGAGVAIPVIALLWVNLVWTGNPLQFGYESLWGEGVGLGFGESPWGEPHTPRLGIELLSLYALRLQTYLFELPVPSLAFVIGALLLVRRVSSFENWTLWSSSLLLLGYFAYWSDGYHLGPRFMYPLAPFLAYWTARLPSVIRSRGVSWNVQRSTLIAGWVAILIGIAQLWPVRYAGHRQAAMSTPARYEEVARRAGVSGATIVVRESWDAQLMARMWAVGITRPEAERIYRTVDACLLDTSLDSVERRGGGAERLKQLLGAQQVDVDSLKPLRTRTGSSLRFLPGATYTQVCARRLAEAEEGWTLWEPALLVDDGNTWLRDLHSLSSPGVNRGAPLWILRPDSTRSELVRLERLPWDSVLTEWQQSLGP